MSRIITSQLPINKPHSENIVELIFSGLNKHHDVVLLIDSASDRRWTGSSLKNAIANIGSYLKNKCNLRIGDVCSIFGTDSDSSAILILAIISIGCIPSFFYSSRFGSDIYDTSISLKSKILLTTDSLLVKLSAHLTDLQKQLEIILFDKNDNKNFKNIEFLLQTNQESNINIDDLIEESRKLGPDEFACIQFSSGTTGKPKAIPRTHSNLCHLVSLTQNPELVYFKVGDVITGSLTLGHRPGQWIQLASIVYGCTFLLWDLKSKVESLLVAIDKYKATSCNTSLPILAQLDGLDEKIKQKYNLSSVQHMICHGTKILNENLPKRIINMFGLESFRQGFGMTESGLICLIEKNIFEGNYLSVGHPTPGTEIKIIDVKTGNALGANESGELAIRGPQIFPGYYDANINQLIRTDFDQDGFFKIGDRGYYDENNLFYIEGRLKEMIKTRTNRIFLPTEAEVHLSKHKSVQDVCVVKMNKLDDKLNSDYAYDVAKGFVILKPGHQASAEELLEFLEKNSICQLDGGIQFVNEFPRFANGKIDKKRLIEITS